MNALQRLVLLAATALWAGLCFALPAPHDIEQAVAQGRLPQAEQMLREVIAEKPGSAKAQYELAQVLAREGRHSEALQALRSARALDPSLHFAQSPEKFEAVARAIEQQAQNATAPSAVAPVRQAAPMATTPPAAPAPQAWLWPALLTGGFALLALWLWRRVQTQPALQPQPASMGGQVPEAPRGFGAAYDPRGAGAGQGPAYPAPPPAPGGGVTGAVVGGLAGVAAGYALSKALEGHAPAANPVGSAAPRPVDPMDDVGLVRMGAPESSNDLGSFDAGSGDDWGDSGNGADDPW